MSLATFGLSLADRLDEDRRTRGYRDDPIAWTRDTLDEHVWSLQGEIMESVRDNHHTAVQSCHGIGKSHIASRAAAWWLSTRPNGFVVTTAPTWPQVKVVLWRYIRQAWKAGGLPGYVTQQAEWKIDGEVVAYGRKPADYDANGFQGVHAKGGVLVIIDEACGVPAQLFTAADALATNDASRVLAIGNPDDNSSHFYRACTGIEPGWHRIKISAYDSPALTGEPVPDELLEALVSRWWVEDKLQRWGRDNPLFQAKVLAEFADSEDGLIPLSWVKAAHRRWNEWWEEQQASTDELPGRRIFGVDVARYGADKTTIAARQGHVLLEPVRQYSKIDTVRTTDLVEHELRSYPVTHAVVDDSGVGGGVVDQLRARAMPVVAFNGGNRTDMRDATGEYGFLNVRSASHWNMRELLDPGRGARIALPPEDDDLTADLTTPKWELRAGGIIQVEPKDDIKKRLGKSPDVGDAAIEAFWTDVPEGDREDLSLPLEPIDYDDAPTWGF